MDIKEVFIEVLRMVGCKDGKLAKEGNKSALYWDSELSKSHKFSEQHNE